MKKYLIVAGVLAVIATPAFAQSYNPEFGTANELPFAYGPGTSMSGYNDYAQAPVRGRSAHTRARTESWGRDDGYVIGRRP